MKPASKSNIGRELGASLMAALAFIAVHPVRAQTPLGTAFTYQGQLKDGGFPANGIYDLRFKLFNAGGTQVGSSICANDFNIVDGLFTLPLDFSGNPFDGTKRFLEVSVRVDNGIDCGTGGLYTVINPLQELTAAPYARFAPNAGAAPWSGLTGVPAGFADGIDNGNGDGHSLDAADGSPVDALFVNNAGSVGIGTTSPASILHIDRNSDAPANINVDSGTSTVQVSSIDFYDRGTFKWGLGKDNFNEFFIMNGPTRRMTIRETGQVGIGTATPAAMLQVINNQASIDSAVNGYATAGHGVRGESTSAFGSGVLGISTTAGGVGGSFHNTAGGVALKAFGTAQVNVLEILGADLAEKFPTSDKVEPGMVVAIDPANAGKLCLARGAYNRCVAGVVSGANGFSVGAVLGNLPGHEDAPAVALSGRVYVWCDAATGAIQPGDMLTTSGTPGHAMKATDSERAHGAVIGKAMTGLTHGERGMVLVLVNLQ